MGILAPIVAGIGAAFGSAATAVGGAAAAVGGAAAGAAGAATSGTILGGLTTAATLAGGAATAASLIRGAPKPPDLPATPAAAPAPPTGITPAGGSNKNTSLAAQSPGLALSGTSQFLGGGSSGSQKSLLGQ